MSAEPEEQPLPLLQHPRMSPVDFIETDSELNAAIEKLSGGKGPFAIDAERASGFKYSQRAYLIQIARSGSGIFLIDPIAITQTSGLAPFNKLSELLATQPWILHAASQDLPCLAEIGLRPKLVMDTELGGRLAGLERVGLGAMTERYLQVRLAKEHSAVDWSTRPLNQEWLNYAALDVDVLFELWNNLENDLISQSKFDWAMQEFEAITGFVPKTPKPDRWRSLSGLHEVKNQRSLAVAKELWEARESLAIKLDLSPGRLIPDSSIVVVAKNTPKSRSQLASMRDFVGRASRNYLDVWWTAIESGLRTIDLPEVRVASEAMPNHRTWPNRFPEAHRRLKYLRTVIADESVRLKIPAENLCSPDVIRQLAWEPPPNLVLNNWLTEKKVRPWQVELLAEKLSESLAEVSKAVDSDSDPGLDSRAVVEHGEL